MIKGSQGVLTELSQYRMSGQGVDPSFKPFVSKRNESTLIVNYRGGR